MKNHNKNVEIFGRRLIISLIHILVRAQPRMERCVPIHVYIRIDPALSRLWFSVTAGGRLRGKLAVRRAGEHQKSLAGALASG